MMQYYAAAILLLNGCAGLGVDLSDDRTIVIQKSPYLVIASGDLEQHDYDGIREILSDLDLQPFCSFDFEPIIVNVNGSETEIKKYSYDNNRT